MTPIVVSIDINRPPAEVFAYATDPSHFPEWQRDVASTDTGGADPHVVGSRFRTTRQFAGMKQTLTQQVTEVSSPTRWVAEGIDGVIRPKAALSVEPLRDGAASRVTFSVTYQAGGLGRAIMPLVLRQTEKGAPLSFKRLKEQLER